MQGKAKVCESDTATQHGETMASVLGWIVSPLISSTC